jgi:DNA repair protein RadC
MSLNRVLPRVIDLPSEERPRERFARLGAAALSTEELLAILLGSGSSQKPVLNLARELLVTFQSLQGIKDAALEELQKVSGIGLAKAIQLKAALALNERKETHHPQPFPSIKKPEEAFKSALPHLKGAKKEILLALLLNASHRLISVEVISIGILSATLIHPREFFHPAIKRHAAYVIAVHNHPSGQLTPSKEDLEVTARLIEAGRLMDIPLIDHLIVSDDGFLSLREQGLEFGYLSNCKYICNN